MKDSFLRDLRFGLRMLGKTPGATLVAIASLALGIGATTAIFTIVNGVLLRPLPYTEPDRLVVVWEQNQKKGIREFNAAPPNFRDWTERSHSFTRLCALLGGPATLTGAGQPERIEVARVSASLFSTLGVQALFGRVFTEDDGDPSRGRVAVLSEGLWKRRFGGDRGVLGRTVTLDGTTYTIAGVADANPRLFSMATEVWVPYILDKQELAERGFHTLKVIGRLRAGTTIAQAQSEMTSIAGQLAGEYPDMNANWGVSLTPLQDQMTGNLRRPLWVLLGAVGLVLSIACVNVASILLMKAGTRRRELAIRATLGASATRVIAQLLTESLVLAVVAGLAGVVLAWWGTKLLVRITPSAIADIGDLAMDWRVLVFALATAISTGLLFGMAPALSAVRTDLIGTLRSAGRSGMSSARWGRIRSVLVVAELMLAQVLLIGAGLLIHSLVELRRVPPGFQTERVVSARLALPDTRYKGLAVGRFYERLVDKIGAIPGIEHAAVTRDLPLSGANPSLNFEIEGRPPLSPSEQPRARYRTAGGEYFSALDIKLIRGRFFERTDSGQTQPVAIINETLARREWPNQDPLGHRVRSGFDGSPWCTIIGIAGDVHSAALDAPADAEIYYHYLQVPAELMTVTEGSMTAVVRTRDNPFAAIGSIRGEVAQLDGDLALYDVRVADEHIAGSVEQPRFRTIVLAVFAALALVLSAIGLYGLLASTVVQRTNELGIRKALGATVGDVLGMVVRQGFSLALAGVAAGLLLGLLLSRVLQKMMFGVGPFDWIAFVLTPAILLAIALMASLIPAWRAGRVDPAIALREQ